MRKLLFLNLYHILIDGGYENKENPTPDQINHYNFLVENIVEEILRRKTGQIILEGIRDSSHYVVIRPKFRYIKPDGSFVHVPCSATTQASSEMQKNVLGVFVAFTPEPSCNLDPSSHKHEPGADPTEVLFHELVHSFNAVTETPYDRKINNPFVPPALRPKYDTEDDFFAILITNIFASETSRPLRGGHEGFKRLQPELSTDDGFLAVEDYARLVKQFCDDHPSVSRELSRVTSEYNPIRRFLVGPFAKSVQQIEGRPPIPMVEQLPAPTQGMPARRP
jgi:hypothetical protein